MFSLVSYRAHLGILPLQKRKKEKNLGIQIKTEKKFIEINL